MFADGPRPGLHDHLVQSKDPRGDGMALGDGVRRNIRTVSAEEAQRFSRALLALQEAGLSEHERDGVEFLPWHRELCNRVEERLREVDPALSLHYWDWNEDPRDLFTPTFSLAAEFGLPFAPADADPLNRLRAFASDAVILRAPTFTRLSALLERKHAVARFAYFGGTVVNAHVSLSDPWAMLLHSNLDRLFAMWQSQPGDAWRLDPSRVYGNVTDDISAVLLEPWSTETAAHQTISTARGGPKTYVHPSVVAPPCFDTLRVRIEVDPITNHDRVIRFRDVRAGTTFARAASFRISGRGNLSFTVTSGPTGPYSVLTPGGTITAPHSPSLEQEVRVWFGYTGERPNTTAREGAVTIRCEELQQDFSFRLRANTIDASASTGVHPAEAGSDAGGTTLCSRPASTGVTWTWTWRSVISRKSEIFL